MASLGIWFPGSTEVKQWLLTVVLILRPGVAVLPVLVFRDVLQVVHCGPSPCCHGGVSAGTRSGGSQESERVRFFLFSLLNLPNSNVELSKRYWQGQ